MSVRTVGVFTAFLSLVATSAVVIGFTGSAATAEATDQSYWIPVDKRVTVRGHGYGHGHGMSQYGAQGAARQGKSYREIVDFYYPGTSWSRVRGLVRVLITADTSADTKVSPQRGLSVRDLSGRATYDLPDVKGVRYWRLIETRAGDTVVGYYTNRWRRYRPGGAPTLKGDGEFFAPAPIRLHTANGSTRYRGRLRFVNKDTVNVLSMDNYVKGVVADEMPASWHPEAVKSQSVAARTYATWSRSQNWSRYYQICDTTSCQVYGGVDAEDSRSNAAVNATRRQILTYRGDPAFTQFSSSSGGWTSKGSVPYLPAKRDPYDGWSGNPVHNWSMTIDAGYFERAYSRLGTLRRIRVVNRDGNGDWNGRVNTVVLDGARSDVTISGDSFRWAFGLRSNWFTIDPTPIVARWTRIGAQKSRLGAVRTKEYRVRSGAAQGFARGRIYYSNGTGARELYGPILRTYQRIGGPNSALRLPRTQVQATAGGQRAVFQRGVIYSKRGPGTVPVLGKIAWRYLDAGGAGSRLGWPTRTNYRIRGGQRTNFQHGYITWSKHTKKTRVRVTS